MSPSHAIARSAAQILVVGAGGRDAPTLLEDVLDQGSDFALQMIALIAPAVWGKEALAKLLHRLNGPLSPNCRWLLRELPRISKGQADEAIREVLVRSLTTDDPHIAIAAAETLQSQSNIFLETILFRLQAAFSEWSARGDYCEYHQHYVHDECHDYFPLCPRAEILKLLVRFSALTLSQLLDACHDPHDNVCSFAAQEVARVLAVQQERIAEVVYDVGKRKHPSSVLEEILSSLPATTLMTAQEALMTLFFAESVVLRRIMVRRAATAAWLTKEQAINIVQGALEDSDLTVRNLAVAALRSLKGSS